MARYVWLGVLVVCGVIAIALWRAARAGVVVQAARVSRAAIREFVDEQGKTRLPETHLITMPFEGRIQAIDWQEGAVVEQDQVVARISPDDLDNAVAEAQAAVERLDASLAENDDVSVERSSHEQALRFVESMVATVAAAEARKTSGRSRLDFAETNLGRVRELHKSRARTLDDLDRAELSFVEGKVDYQQDVLVAEAMKSLKAATDLLPRMVLEYIARKGLTHHVLAKQKSEAEARLRQATLNRERGTLRSPVKGVVLERRIRNEQFLSGGTILMRIGQLEQLEVEADILSEDVVRVRPGAEVEIYGPAIGAGPGAGVAGVVDRIYPAGFTKISSLGVEQQRVTVVIRFREGVLEELRPRRELGVDYRVRVRIFTAASPAALVVPRSALFRGADNGWQVFAIRAERIELQPVDVGLLNDEFAEIKTGLAEGEPVVLAPESSLTVGTRVSPVMRSPP